VPYPPNARPTSSPQPVPRAAHPHAVRPIRPGRHTPHHAMHRHTQGGCPPEGDRRMVHHEVQGAGESGRPLDDLSEKGRKALAAAP